MKYRKVLSILVLATVLSLLALAIPASPVQAQAITLSPTSGTAGSTVTVNGTGFTAYAAQTVYILFNYTYIVSASVDSAGAFSQTFVVPSGYTTTTSIAVTVQHTTTTYDTTKQITAASFSVIVRRITISPSSRSVGEQTTVSGNGFAASSSMTFYLDNAAVSAATATTTDASGSFTATLTMPAAPRGSHTIKAQDASANYATATVTIVQKITTSPISGAVGDTITINGTGFTATKTVTFYWDNAIVSATTATTTDSGGSFTNSTFTVPSASRGSHTLKAQDSVGYSAVFTFTIAEKITITPTTGAPAATVTVAGSGFRATQTITIKYNNVAISTNPAVIYTDSSGAFNASFSVPAGLAGTYTVLATDGTYTASANFTSVANATVSQTTTAASPGHVGMELTVNGTGFTPNTVVTISYATDPVVLATVTTDSIGAFTVVVTIPPSTSGSHTITVTDNYTTQTLTFVMESAAPPVPVLLLPADTTKAKSKAYFDWEDVTDDSGVTYTLQIASDTNFTNIILQKTGLATSEYQLTDEEKLESTGKDVPYYWRVEAVDGASNASAWTTPLSFYVGFIFSMPSWAPYIFFGIGALAMGLLGFWLGRRTAYY